MDRQTYRQTDKQIDSRRRDKTKLYREDRLTLHRLTLKQQTETDRHTDQLTHIERKTTQHTNAKKRRHIYTHISAYTDKQTNKQGNKLGMTLTDTRTQTNQSPQTQNRQTIRIINTDGDKRTHTQTDTKTE